MEVPDLADTEFCKLQELINTYRMKEQKEKKN